MRTSQLILAAILLIGCGGGVDKKPNATPNSTPNNGTQNAATNSATNGATNNGSTNGTNNVTGTGCYEDADGDGFGRAEVAVMGECVGADLVTVGGDCDDADEAVFPGAFEYCDGIDRDCSGAWDPEVPQECNTIQDAIAAAEAIGFTGEIQVSPGTYNENIDFLGSSVRVVGSSPENTILDGGGTDAPVVTFASGELLAAGLENFTVRGGRGRADGDIVEGGGIFVAGASPTLRNLLVTDNRADGDSGFGGGIHLADSAAVLERITVYNNRAGYYGGGIHAQSSNATFRQLAVISNEAIYGAGMAIYFSDATIESTVFAGNVGSFGGAVVIQGDTNRLANVTFVENSADRGGALYLSSGATPTVVNATFSLNSAMGGGAVDAVEGDPDISYANFFDNGANPFAGFTASDVTGLLEVDPDFVSMSGDPYDWDLHLPPTSPLRNAGDPSLTDPDGTRSDIGAYGGEFGDW